MTTEYLKLYNCAWTWKISVLFHGIFHFWTLTYDDKDSSATQHWNRSVLSQLAKKSPNQIETWDYEKIEWVVLSLVYLQCLAVVFLQVQIFLTMKLCQDNRGAKESPSQGSSAFCLWDQLSKPGLLLESSTWQPLPSKRISSVKVLALSGLGVGQELLAGWFKLQVSAEGCLVLSGVWTYCYGSGSEFLWAKLVVLL